MNVPRESFWIWIGFLAWVVVAGVIGRFDINRRRHGRFRPGLERALVSASYTAICVLIFAVAMSVVVMYVTMIKSVPNWLAIPLADVAHSALVVPLAILPPPLFSSVTFLIEMVAIPFLFWALVSFIIVGITQAAGNRGLLKGADGPPLHSDPPVQR